mmetsp:Transcript_427/g.810  ORF Transcript_427/g.810 Transcript_427/m.810 type:complete len:340 (-) Transcript_427:314-1333(-)
MGGKKAIGEHPSRGRRFTGISRRGGHSTVHRGYDTPNSDEEGSIPAMQEFSLFSQFDISPDRFGILQNDISSDEKTEKHSPTPTKTPSSPLPPKLYGQSEGISNVYIMNEIQKLQHTVYNLVSAFGRLEYEFYTSMNSLYYYGGASPNACPHTSSPSPKVDEPDKGDGNLSLKKLHERLSTLEGRHRSMQSKISQLDNIYGRSSEAWAKNIKRYAEFESRNSLSNGSTVAGDTKHLKGRLEKLSQHISDERSNDKGHNERKDAADTLRKEVLAEQPRTDAVVDPGTRDFLHSEEVDPNDMVPSERTTGSDEIRSHENQSISQDKVHKSTRTKNATADYT